MKFIEHVLSGINIGGVLFFYKKIMVEVPEKGASGIQLSTISPEENQQFNEIVGKIQSYSQNLIESFDKSINDIKGKLDSMGSVVLKALNELENARKAMEDLTDESFTQLEQIMDSVSQILVELDCLDSVQADVLRLSDAVTTVESSIKSQ